MDNMDSHPGKNSLFDVATADDIVYRLEISFEYQEYDDKDFAEAERDRLMGIFRDWKSKPVQRFQCSLAQEKKSKLNVDGTPKQLAKFYKDKPYEQCG
jgi:hypothetical protein